MGIIEDIDEHWLAVADSVLINRKIIAVRYLSEDEAERLGWNGRSVVIHLDNGHMVWPSRDDEGNDAGALFTTDPNGDTFPVLSIRYQSNKE